MRIAFVHDWPFYAPQELTWKDGLAAAVKVLSQRHEVRFYVVGPDAVIDHEYFPIHVSSNIYRDVKEFNPDKIIMWADCTRDNAAPLAELGKPMALCFAGGSVDGPTNMYFDHFFVESRTYFDAFTVRGKSVSYAFGTNTDLFKPQPNQQKYFDTIFPATYAGWKRHHIFAEAIKGLNACSVGYIIPAEKIFYDKCEAAGALALPHVSADVLVKLFAASHTCTITSYTNGGSQRTVLEAMAMNIPLVVCKDSEKTSEYVLEAGEGKLVETNPNAIKEAIFEMRTKQVNTRDYIMSKWSHVHYADAMDKWIHE